MMLLPEPRTPKLVPPPTYELVLFGALQVLPLDAELGGAIGADLDDQRLDEDLRAPVVELLDDRADVVVHRLRRHHDQRIVRGVGLDGHAARRESTAARTVATAAEPRRNGGAAPLPPVALIAVLPTLPPWRPGRHADRPPLAPASPPPPSAASAASPPRAPPPHSSDR